MTAAWGKLHEARLVAGGPLDRDDSQADLEVESGRPASENLRRLVRNRQPIFDHRT